MPNIDKLVDSNLTKDESRIIGFMQTISILSVITAHVITKTDSFDFRGIVTSFLSAFGCVGVAIFFLLGGFLYNRKQGDFVVFWRKKLHGLIIPWFVCSFLTYIIKVVTTHQIGLLDYCKWVLGYGTWYYYSTVYIVFLALFSFLRKRDAFLYVVVGLNIVSLIISTVDQQWLPIPFLTPYLNIFNWIGFFALGVLVRKHRWDRNMSHSIGLFVVSVFSMLLTLVLMFVFNTWGYFSILGMVFELAFAIVLLYVARAICNLKWAGYIAKFGAYTYCIYLLHMPIVQPICARLPNMWVADIIKPLLGLTIMISLVYLGKKICGFLPFGDRICRLVGIRFR